MILKADRNFSCKDLRNTVFLNRFIWEALRQTTINYVNIYIYETKSKMPK